MTHKLKIITEHKSKAKHFRGKNKQTVLHRDFYTANFKVTNVSDEDFPGGEAIICVEYGSRIMHPANLVIPAIKKGDTEPIKKNRGIVKNEIRSQSLFQRLWQKISRREQRPQSEAVIDKPAAGIGYALFFVEDITAKDGKPVKIIRDDKVLPIGLPPDGASFYDFFVMDRTEVYTYRSLKVSMLALIVLATISLAQLLSLPTILALIILVAISLPLSFYLLFKCP